MGTELSCYGNRLTWAFECEEGTHRTLLWAFIRRAYGSFVFTGWQGFETCPQYTCPRYAWPAQWERKRYVRLIKSKV